MMGKIRSWAAACLFILLLLGNIAEATAARELLDLPVPQNTPVKIKKLTLREAILLAMRMNPSVRSAEIQRVADKYALEVAHNQFAPQYTFTANANFADGSKPTYTYSPGASLKLPLGTTIQTNLTQNFTGSRNEGTGLTTTITQPLMQGFGPQVTMAPLLSAEYTEHTNRLNLKNTVITTITQVVQNYYALVQAYNNLTVDELALENSATLLQQYHIRIRAGQAAPLEIAPQESQYASQKLQVTQDKNAIQQAYLTLLTTLGLDPNSHLQIETKITVDDFEIPELDRSTDLALENNIGYLQAVYQLKQDEISLLLAKDAQRWTLNLVATKEFSSGGSTSGTNLTTVNGTTIIPSGSGVTGGDSVAVNLTVPINDKALRQQLIDAQVSLAQQIVQLAETKRELRSNVIENTQTLIYQQQQIKQAQAAVVYAQQAFDAEVKKLYYGRSTVLNVTQLRDSLTQAQLSLINQQITYINTLAQYEALLGITLDRWDIALYY